MPDTPSSLGSPPMTLPSSPSGEPAETTPTEAEPHKHSCAYITWHAGPCACGECDEKFVDTSCPKCWIAPAAPSSELSQPPTTATDGALCAACSKPTLRHGSVVTVGSKTFHPACYLAPSPPPSEIEELLREADIFAASYGTSVGGKRIAYVLRSLVSALRQQKERIGGLEWELEGTERDMERFIHDAESCGCATDSEWCPFNPTAAELANRQEEYDFRPKYWHLKSESEREALRSQLLQIRELVDEADWSWLTNLAHGDKGPCPERYKPLVLDLASRLEKAHAALTP